MVARRAVPLVLATACAVVVSAAGHPAPAPAATSTAAPICAGEEATIVGQGQRSLNGTAGRDVVVTGGARFVNARGGDDLVCVTGRPGATAYVDAGDGDDEVRGRAGAGDGGRVQFYLGSGGDTFVGGPGPETVDVGDGGDTDLDDDEPDVVRAGGGADSITSGALEVPLRDDIDLGPGRDEVLLAGRVLAEDARLDGGAGADALVLRGTDAYLDSGGGPPVTEQDWTFRNTPTTGTAESGGVERLRWSSFERFSLFAVARSNTFLGGSGDETVVSDNFAGVDLGAGDDVARAFDDPKYSPPSGPVAGPLDGGPGRDLVDLGIACSRVLADLGSDRYRCARPSGPVRLALTGLEGVAVTGGTVTVRGTAAAERLSVQACRATVVAGGGADVVRVLSRDTYFEQVLVGCGDTSRPAEVHAGRGPDRLLGSRHPDRLVGGAGRDTAYGAGGRDVCRAEVRRRCEVG